MLTGYVLHEVLGPERPADAVAYLALTASDLWPGSTSGVTPAVVVRDIPAHCTAVGTPARVVRCRATTGSTPLEVSA